MCALADSSLTRRLTGTGYLYARWRPGFGTVVVFLSLLTAAFQLLFQTLNHKRDVARLSRVIDDALKAAGTAGAKKVKIEVGGSIRECSVTADGEVYLVRLDFRSWLRTLLF